MKHFLLLLAFAAPTLAQTKTQPVKPAASAKPALKTPLKPALNPADSQKQIVVEAAKLPTPPRPGNLKMMPPSGHLSPIGEGQLSPDGKWAITMSYEEVRIWEVAPGRTARVLNAASTCARWLNDSKRVLIGGEIRVEGEPNHGALQLWDAPSGKMLRQWDFPPVDGPFAQSYTPAVHFMDVSADQKRVLIITGGIGGAQVCEIETGKVLRDFGNMGALHNGHFFNNDTEWIGYYTDEGYWYKDINSVHYNVQTGAKLGDMPVRAAPMSWTKDGKIFVIGRAATATPKGERYDGAPGPSQSGIYDEKTGALLRAVEDGVNVAAFSPDGKWLAYGKGIGLKALELATGKIIPARAEPARGIVIEGLDAPHEPPVHGGNVYAISWSKDGKSLLSSGSDNASKVWSWPQFTPRVGLRGWSFKPEFFALAPDGQRALVSSVGGYFYDRARDETDQKSVLGVVDTNSGRTLLWLNYDKPVNTALFLPDGKTVYIVSGNRYGTNELRRFNIETGELSAPLFVTPEGADFSLSTYKNSLLVTGQSRYRDERDDKSLIFDIQSGQKTAETTALIGGVFNAKGQIIRGDRGVETWDVQTGERISATGTFSDLKWPALPNAYFEPMDAGDWGDKNTSKFVNGGAQFLLPVTFKAKVAGEYEEQATIFKRDSATGQLLQVWEPFVRAGALSEFSISQDEKRAVLFDGTKKMWQLRDAQTGALLRESKERGDSWKFLNPDRNLQFETEANNTISVRDVNGKLLYSYLTMEDGDWLAYLPDGRFDGSQNAISKVSFSQGDKTYGLEQFVERFYQPGLIPLVLGGLGGNGNITPSAVLAAGTPPVVKIIAPTAGDTAKNEVEVVVEARAQNGGGVKAIRLYHNGRLVGGPGNLRGIVVEAATQNGVKTQKFSVTLVPGDNALRAVAYSQTDLESLPDTVRLVSTAPPGAKPVLRVLAVGVNVYRDATMNLTYARPDAEALASLFEKQSEVFSDIKITRLLDENATGEAIKTALSQMAEEAAPGDVAVIYLAGHGETAAPNAADDDKTDARQAFYFLPSDTQFMLKKENVRRFGLSGPTLDALVSKIPARRVFMIYDACKSGAAVDNLTRSTADEQQELALLARAQGIFILTASTGQQFAGEVRALGHGILTYALLEGLGGKAAQNDSQVRVSELLTYTEGRVPALAKEFRGREQFPVRYGRGQNFALAAKP